MGVHKDSSPTDGTATPMTITGEQQHAEPDRKSSYRALFRDDRVLKKFYDRWYEQLYALLAAESETRREKKQQQREVLHYQLKQGWTPLCTFLGHDIPRKEGSSEEEMDLPRSNSSDDFLRGFKTMWRIAAILAVAKAVGWIVLPVGLAGTAYWYFRGQR